MSSTLIIANSFLRREPSEPGSLTPFPINAFLFNYSVIGQQLLRSETEICGLLNPLANLMALYKRLPCQRCITTQHSCILSALRYILARREIGRRY
ncbi:Uncharacterised protein [Vibrio cholerae]|nr:Uncharacterised protein [Vibrio cholerae]CSC99466.1 Uncharacterised protein [Vibrio cholerae]